MGKVGRFCPFQVAAAPTFPLGAFALRDMGGLKKKTKFFGSFFFFFFSLSFTESPSRSISAMMRSFSAAETVANR